MEEDEGLRSEASSSGSRLLSLDSRREDVQADGEAARLRTRTGKPLRDRARLKPPPLQARRAAPGSQISFVPHCDAGALPVFIASA